MPLAERFHGTRVLAGVIRARPIATEDYSTIGTVVIAPNADAALYPLNVATTVFTANATARAALGAGGNVDAVWDAFDDQADRRAQGDHQPWTGRLNRVSTRFRRHS